MQQGEWTVVEEDRGSVGLDPQTRWVVHLCQRDVGTSVCCGCAGEKVVGDFGAQAQGYECGQV